MLFRDERLRVVGIGGTLREGSPCLGALRLALEAAEGLSSKERGARALGAAV